MVLDYTPLPKQAYDAIKQLMIDGKLSPGESVVEQSLAKLLGMSRVPVREALLALEKEGLLKKVGAKSRIVAEVSIVDIMEIFDIREMMESVSARLLATRITDEQLAELRALDVPYPSNEDEIRFHTYVVENCGNSRLRQMSRELNIQLLQMQINSMLDRLGVVSSDWIEAEKYPHAEVIQALEERNPDKAEAAVRKQLRRNKDTLKRRVMER